MKGRISRVGAIGHVICLVALLFTQVKPVHALLAPDANHTSVVIVAGQSNAVGQGATGHQLKTLAGVDANVPFFYSSNFDSSSGAWTTLGMQGSTSPYYGPEVGIGRTLYQAGRTNVAIIKVAFGATTLATHWNPSGGSMYTSLTTNSTTALGLVTTDTYSVDAFYWLQGESDATVGDAPNYQTNLTNFISTVRTYYGKPNLPFVIARVYTNSSGNTYRGDIQTAQDNVASSVPNVYIVNTDTLNVPDDIHYDGASLLALGTKMAQVSMPDISIKTQRYGFTSTTTGYFTTSLHNGEPQHQRVVNWRQHFLQAFNMIVVRAQIGLARLRVRL